MNQFTNPIVPARGTAGSADPSVVHRDGFYYYCKSIGDAAIGVAKAARLQDIDIVPMTKVWAPPAGTLCRDGQSAEGRDRARSPPAAQ